MRAGTTPTPLRPQLVGAACRGSRALDRRDAQHRAYHADNEHSKAGADRPRQGAYPNSAINDPSAVAPLRMVVTVEPGLK